MRTDTRATRTQGILRWAGLLLIIAAWPLAGAMFSQKAVSLPDLATLRQEPHGAKTAVADTAAPMPLSFAGVAGLPDEVPVIDEEAAGPRAGVVDLYRGLQPSTGFWYWTSGGSKAVYWALDDGLMGPGAAAVGGGHVTEYQFSFGVYGDFPGDTHWPYVIVSFYNAPPDPVANATNPVVEPPTPVSSIGWMFNPITSPAGFRSYKSPLINLAALGWDFDLDKTYYVEIIPLEWSSYPSGMPVLDPNVFAVFTGPGTVSYGTNQDHLWSDFWVRYAGGIPQSGDGDWFYDHPAEMDVGGFSPYLNQSGIILRGLECTGANTLELSINEPADICVKPNETVTVTMSQSCLPGLVRGYQAFLAFDTSRLSFGSGTYITPLPYGLPILAPIVAVVGEIDLAAGIDDPSGQSPTSSTADLVTLTFTAGTTEGLTNVSFRSHEPPSRFSDPLGQPVVPTLVNSPNICIDGTPPSINCPPAVNVQCVGQVPTAAANYTQFLAQGGTASDTGCCGTTVTVTHKGDTNNGGAGCPGSPLIITRTYRATDSAGNYAECEQTITVLDNTAPTFVGFPANRTQNADAGLCTAVLVPAIVPPTGSDNCDSSPVIAYKRSDGMSWNVGLTDPYPSGVTMVTWKVTDTCGNSITQNQAVTISGFNELVVSAQLSPIIMAGTITRCITFELWECPDTAPNATVNQVMSFTGGSTGPVTVLAPCGNYTCITARDKLHTLRRTATPTIVGTQWVADFTGDPATGGDWLIGGNLNDDKWIDILDFGVFSSQWAVNYGSGSTTCSTPSPHADISGNGLVFSEDFTFIQINFLLGSAANCCGAPGFRDGEAGNGPITSIPVAQLRQMGLGHLAAGDLNKDGVLDQADVAAFLMGARPKPQPNLEEAEAIPMTGQAGNQLPPPKH